MDPDRLKVLKAMLLATSQRRELDDLIAQSETDEDAVAALAEPPFLFGVTEAQIVLNMTLRMRSAGFGARLRADIQALERKRRDQ
jgi:hypothetical protein